MTKVEGSRSYKAIAFIKRKSNPRTKNLDTKDYSKRKSIKKSQFFSKKVFLVKKTSREYYTETLGDKNE